MRRVLPLLLLLAAAAPAAAQSQRYIVATRHSADDSIERMIGESREAARRAVRPFRSVNAFAADLTPEELAQLRRSPHVRWIEPVQPRFASSHAPAETNGSLLQSHETVPYGVDLVRARELWPLTRGAGRVNIAILDTGIDPAHPELRRSIAGGWNTYTKTADPADDNRHGTHVAGTIAAAANSVGIVGVAPEARIWPVKVLDKTGFGTTEQIIAGVDWVVQKKEEVGGNWIMNLSLGASAPSDVEREAFRRAVAAGILIFAASGNQGFIDIQYPAGYPDVIAVGAVDDQRAVAGFSNWGPMLDIVAPGVKVLSTVPVGSVTGGGEVQLGIVAVFGNSLAGSPMGEVRAPYVFCGLGRPNEIPAAVAGKIAVIRRGEITFNEKVRNAKAAGAVGAVILNGVEHVENMASWSLIISDCTSAGCTPRASDVEFSWPVTIGLSFADGQQLLARDPNQPIAILSGTLDYAPMSGTSMATPHVAAVAALVWSLAPEAPAAQVAHALLETARDIGAPGIDQMTGHGLVDAVKAAQLLAPSRFAPPSTPPPSNPPRRRASGG